jgi:hypothetical protein
VHGSSLQAFGLMPQSSLGLFRLSRRLVSLIADRLQVLLPQAVSLYNSASLPGNLRDRSAEAQVKNAIALIDIATGTRQTLLTNRPSNFENARQLCVRIGRTSNYPVLKRLCRP